MRFKFIILIILFIVNNLLIACDFKSPKGYSSLNEESTFIDQKMEFKKLIDTIENKIVDLTTPVDLFYVKEFNQIFNNPELYLNDASDFIFYDSSINKQQKMIALYAMQNLPVKEYTLFFLNAAEVYINGNFNDDYLMMLIIGADFSKDEPIISNFNSTDINVALKKIENNNKTSNNIKNWIIDILAGKKLK